MQKQREHPPILSGKDIERFLRKVSIADSGHCWEWSAGTNEHRDGYGQFHVMEKNGERRALRAHRVMHFLVTREWPPIVQHKCDNPRCVNPAHLESGDYVSNADDMKKKGRSASGDKNGMRKHPERHVRGEMSWNSKLTDSDVREIRRLRSIGVQEKVVAARFQIHRNHVGEIFRRKLWSHVE